MVTQDDLQQIRILMREEIEVSEKRTIQTIQITLGKRIDHLETRLENVEISHNNLVKEFMQMRHDIQTLDMKIEVVNRKVDTLYDATVDGFQRVINTMDKLIDPLKERITVLEAH